MAKECPSPSCKAVGEEWGTTGMLFCQECREVYSGSGSGRGSGSGSLARGGLVYTPPEEHDLRKGLIRNGG